MLSLVFVVAGLGLVLGGLFLAVASMVEIFEQGGAARRVVLALFAAAGLALTFGSVRIVTRLRPAAVWRFCGHRVPPVPSPLAAIWKSPSGGSWGGYAAGTGGDGGGGGGGGDGGGGC